MSRGHLTAQPALSLCVGEPPGPSVGGVGFLLLPSSLSLPGVLLVPAASGEWAVPATEWL